MRLRASLDFGDGKVPIEVGTLAWSAAERRAYVQWSDQIRGSQLNVAPLLVKDWNPLHTTANPRAFHGLPAVFGDSVSDGWGRLLMDRELMGRVSDEPRAMVYLAMVGRHGMGAMIYEPADQEAERVKDLSLDYFARAAGEIEAIDHDVLGGLRAVSGGSQGARPKFVALFEEATGRYRDHRSPWKPGLRHVLVKRAAPGDLPSAVQIEAAYARAARQAGIAMAATSIVRSSRNEPFFQTTRFDRLDAGRVHMQSAAALTEVDYRDRALTYENLFQISYALHRDNRDAEQLLRRLAFNVAVMNQDDHAKNHAYLMSPEGKWALSPAFDITYAPGPGGYHAMGLSSDEIDMRPAAILDLAARHGIDAARARNIINEVIDAARMVPEFLVDEGTPPKTASAIEAEIHKALRQLPQ